MKKFWLILTAFPFLAVGDANAQQVPARDPNVLSTSARELGRKPWINPDWTWMTGVHAIQILKADGFGVITSLQMSGGAWHGQAKKDNDSYHFAINRYADIYSDVDHTDLEKRPVISTVMGEMCWTWLREDEAVQLLKAKGFSEIRGLRRGDRGTWEARAIKDSVVHRVSIDWYGNTQHQQEGAGGFAQADSAVIY